MKKMEGSLSSLIYTLGYISYLLSQWLVSIFIINTSGLEDAGYFGLAMTVTSVFYMISSYGIRSYQISDLKPLFADEEYINARIVTVVIGFASCMAYSVILGYNSKQLLVIGLYMLFKSCEAFYDVLHGIWQKGTQLIAVGKSLFTKAALSVICFWLPYHITTNLVFGLASMSGAAVILLIVDYRFTMINYAIPLRPQSSRTSVALLLKSTFIMMLLILCAPVIPAAPRIVLEKTAGPEVLGIYTSLSTPTTLISAFASTIFLPLIPRYTTAYSAKDSRKIFRLIASSSGIMLVVGFVASVAIHFCGEWVITLVYGKAVGEYYELMHGVVFSAVLASIIMCLNNLLVGIRQLRQELFFMILGCVLCIIFSFVLVPRLEMHGAIGATIISQGIQVIAEVGYITILLRKLTKSI